MSILCSWGNNENGQLGFESSCVDDDEEAIVSIPTPVPITQNTGSSVIEIACGWYHTLFLLDNGSVYSCGLNDSGQLGRTTSSQFDRVENLPPVEIEQMSCGEYHSLVVNKDGNVYSFGSNGRGQLGVVDDENSVIPRQVELIRNSHVFICQVSCGKDHSIALSSVGQIFCWGNNAHGQLGVGSRSEKNMKPKLLLSLLGSPIYRIYCGSNHSMAITVSGTIFGWGKNEYGQLGTGDRTDKLFPQKIKLISGRGILHLSCGDEHTAALSIDGQLFTFGCGLSGQLGHGGFNNEVNPKGVVDLLGSPVSQICCGRKHTMAFIAGSGRLYAFGLGVKGQLGVNSIKKHPSPVEVNSLWKLFDKQYIDNVYNTEDYKKDNYYFNEDYQYMLNHMLQVLSEQNNNVDNVLLKIYAGNLQSYCILTPYKMFKPPTFHSVLKVTGLCLHNDNTQKLIQQFNTNQDKSVRMRLLDIVRNIFTNKACLCASFLKWGQHLKLSPDIHGIQLIKMRENIKELCKIEEIQKCIIHAVEEYLIPSMKSYKPMDADSLRVYLLIPELPFFDDSKLMWKILLPFAHSFHDLPDESKIIIESWWSKLPPTFFTRLIESFSKAVITILDEKLPETANQVIFRLHEALRTCMTTLEKLFEINKRAEHSVLHSTFYIDGIMSKIDMKADYLNWIQNRNIFSFCQYPFVLDGKVKAALLSIDAELQMQAMVSTTQISNIQSIIQGNDMFMNNPFLVLNIRRDHLVQDTLSGIAAHDPWDLKKPLKIKFSNEDAEDAGGVKKEFFLLLMKEILDPKYGMFDYNSESRLLWFNNGAFEGPEMFELIGTICGLAIYNSIIIDLPFPYCLYKKLLQEEANLEDLKELDPSIARNLEYMLEYQGDDFNDIFDLNFQISEMHFGELKTIDLKPNGANIQVSQENKEEYVTEYVNYKLNKSVASQYNAFATGFRRVCGGDILDFFHPQELMEMVVGSQDYDFADLEKVAQYKGEYYRQHPVIVNFWNVFNKFDITYKKKFLAFLTGSDKVAIFVISAFLTGSDKVSVFGMRQMKFFIQPVAGGEKGEHLPVAHTCFNLLDLPRYPTLDMMQRKLCQAIENSQGFGLV